MKKAAAFLTAGILAASLFTGCSGGNYKVQTGNDTKVYIAPIKGITEDFIRGMDISSVLVEEESGVKYYDAEGNEADLFKILSDNGVNYIRVRVWNDPYDENGKGYGGGNCNADVAAEIGRRAAQYGMKLNVDFHYSDFWADPKKQMCPKAWVDMDISDKADALYAYTKQSLQTILDAGADVGMVQIGNEINNGMAGETKDANIMELLKKGSQAVREISSSYGKDIKIAVHYTNVDASTNIIKKAKWLEMNELDYDIFGISYYSFWHGTVDHMKETMDYVRQIYKKDICILETSFPYTNDDGDCSGNSVTEGDIVGDYICSVQSQANAVWDVMNATVEMGGLGVFYWESAWIPVGSEYESNSEIWNEIGSGWASKYSTDYDPDDAGKYYGGSSWDNQAFFDFNGKLLDSISVFNYEYLSKGKKVSLALDFIKNPEVELKQGEKLKMPKGAEGIFNDRSKNKTISVKWDKAQVAKVDTTAGGEFTVSGVTGGGETVSCLIKVGYSNLLTDASFEDGSNAWNVGLDMDGNPTDIQTKAADAVTGEKAFHFWSGTKQQVFWVEQTVKAPSDGKYTAFASVQGGDAGDDHIVKFYVKVNGNEVASDDSIKLTGWVDWKKPMLTGISASAGDEITVGMYVNCAPGGWGTMDDFCLFKE